MAEETPMVIETANDLLTSIRRTVQTIPEPTAAMTPSDSIVLYLASVADTIPQWGTAPMRRDKLMREFFVREPILASSVFSVAAANSSYRWEIQSEDEALRTYLTTMLEMAQFGEGWTTFISGLSVDLLTQDRGAYIEVIREANRPDAPVVGVSFLEALRCERTGNPKQPVIYSDEEGQRHLLSYWDVAPVVEMPSTISTMRGYQYCAVSRVLASAQIMRDILTYRGEKVGGRFERVLHIVGGPAKQDIKRALQMGDEDTDNAGLTRFRLPTILASLDPTKPVSHVEIPLASLPDNFDLEDEMKWYITTVAMAFGRDYQDFAPLPGGNLGTSHQSETLAQKSKGKGPSLFMRSVEYAMNYRGVVPIPAARFRYKEMDITDEFEREKIRRLRAETRASMIKSAEITPEIARMLAVKDGDYDKELLTEIQRSEQEQRQQAEERLRLNAELNASIRQTPGGRSAGTEVRPPGVKPANVAGAKEAMLSKDFRGNLQSILPMAAIVQSLQANERTRAILPVLDASIAQQKANSDAVSGLVAQMGALVQALRNQPAPQVLVQPTAMPAPEVKVTVPTQPVQIEMTMPETEETVEVLARDGRGLISALRKTIRPKGQPSQKR